MTQETNERKRVTLGVANNLEYILFKSTKEEVEKLTNILKNKQEKQGEPLLCDTVKYPFIKDIDYLGQVEDVLDTHCKDFIPIVYKRKEPVVRGENIEQIYTNSFKCYCSREQINTNAIILHENASSAFRCAAQTIHADYFYVTKTYINESIPDSNRDTEVYKESTDVGETKTNLL